MLLYSFKYLVCSECGARNEMALDVLIYYTMYRLTNHITCVALDAHGPLDALREMTSGVR